MSLPLGAFTPEFLFDLESRMRKISNEEFQRLTESMWYGRVMREMATGSARELMHWFLDTASIDVSEEGSIEFEEIAMHQTAFDLDFASRGFKMLRSKLEDLDGNGIQAAAEWVRMISAKMAYWPQERAVEALLAGESALGYDAKAFFATDHPVNPVDVSFGTYSNLYTNAASLGTSATVGVKLDDRHSLETAFKSFSEIRAAIKAVAMPDGVTPRKLKPAFFLCPPRMTDRLTLLNSAKFVGDTSGGATGGSVDVSALASVWQLQPPVECDELSSAFGGSDVDCYLVTQLITGDSLGGLIYLNREPFHIEYYTGSGGPSGATGLDAVLNRIRELEWHVQGRNKVHYGHPYMIFKLKGQAP